MATLLLSNREKQVRGQDLRRTLLQFLHGFQAIEDALSLFASSYATHDELLATKGHDDILGQFDGHVGDTACHLRAQMVWQVYEKYKPAERRHWIDDTLLALKRFKAETAAILIELHKKQGYMRALGFNRIPSYSEIFDRIGWSVFLDSLAAQDDVPALDADVDSSCRPDSPVPTTPTDVEPIRCFEKSGDVDKIPSDSVFSNTSTHFDVVSSDSSNSSSRASCPPSTAATSPTSSLRAGTTPSNTPSPTKHTKQRFSPYNTHRHVTTDSKWDVTNQLTMLRFLTICRFLSLGKKAQRHSTPDAAKSVIQCRTDPAFVYEETDKKIEEYYNTLGADYKWDDIITNKDRAGKVFLVREEEVAQVWLSALTADWWSALGREVGFEGPMQRFLDSTIVTSPRQIECIAAYASILPIRAEWMIRGTPILLVNRQPCVKGYHTEFYRVMPNISAWPATSSVSDLVAVDIGDKSWFNVDSVTLGEVQTAPWATTAHYIQISNAWTDRKIYDHITDNAHDDIAHPPFPHDDDTCSEHVAHIAKVVETNFSWIVMDTFGEHDQYPFDLLRDVAKDEYTHLVEHMRANGLGDDVVEGYRRASKEAEEWSGRYVLEHMYTEMPFVIGRQVAGIVSAGERPMPMGYRWC